MSIFETVLISAALFSPFIVAAAGLIVLRRLGIRTE